MSTNLTLQIFKQTFALEIIIKTVYLKKIHY